jgi:hypothetical protein
MMDVRRMKTKVMVNRQDVIATLASSLADCNECYRKYKAAKVDFRHEFYESSDIKILAEILDIFSNESFATHPKSLHRGYWHDPIIRKRFLNKMIRDESRRTLIDSEMLKLIKETDNGLCC